MTPSRAAAGEDGAQAAARARLVAELRRSGIGDPRILDAIGRVPRHRFVDQAWHADAYKNRPLPIGHGQTISQPYVVALMTQLLLDGGSRPRVLEVGTGSGYQTALLAELVPAVFSIERLRALSERARALLRELGYRNVHFGYSDGHGGWPAHAPYAGILATAAAEEVPEPLLAQLGHRGRMVIPIGPAGGTQKLLVIDRTARGWQRREAGVVAFVPFLPGRG
ncbi:MAG: protein-L-isoaspartate(D-aspartate) O-methyltransferase [Gammaproteobacteria bacterium]|nr:protein-L-isoaspartate(D-aspartate) O-methyltransferase [Gammaproteobacteria bacterium]